MKPRIHVYTVCWNEQTMLPFFLDYYSQYAKKIVVYDNLSDDRSPSIVNACPIAELRSFDTSGKFDDTANLEIKNEAYKESRGEADFVVVVDTDEFLFHPRLMEILGTYLEHGVTLPKVRGFDMVSWFSPRPKTPLHQQITTGRPCEEYSKRCIFSPQLDIQFSIGAHICNPKGNIVEPEKAELKLLHYHYVGLCRCIRRHSECKGRLPPKMNQVAYQFRWGWPRIVSRFISYHAKAENVFTGQQSTFVRLFGYPIRLLRK